MKRISFLFGALVALAGLLAYTVPASGDPDKEAAPIFGVTIPPGYRDWKLIAVAHLVTGKVDQLRAQLGNEIALKAFKEGKVPFPDGAMIVALHWNRVPSEDNNRVLAGPFPGAQSFVVGSPVNIQVMLKTQSSTPPREGGGSVISRMANLAARLCIKPAFPATSPRKLATSSSPVTRLNQSLAKTLSYP